MKLATALVLLTGAVSVYGLADRQFNPIAWWAGMAYGLATYHFLRKANGQRRDRDA